MPDHNRRKVLKGISLTSAAALAPLSLQAAKPFNSVQNIAMYIDAKHGRFMHSTSNEIINTSNQTIVLSTKQPVGYKSSNGQNLALYINSSAEKQALQPGQRLPVYARSTSIIPTEKMLIQKSYSGHALANV